LQTTLDLVTQQAQQLGVPVGTGAKAMLDAHAVAFGEGAITLHNSEGILRALGTGSSRLLVAGLQRAAAQYIDIVGR
jgi:ribulose kinase